MAECGTDIVEACTQHPNKDICDNIQCECNALLDFLGAGEFGAIGGSGNDCNKTCKSKMI